MIQVTLQHPTAADCLATFWLAAQPRRSLPVSEWADTHRELSGKQAGERGRYRTSRTPFLREIMDCFSYNSRVTDIVVMKSSQVGVTEATVNVIGYVMDHAPCPMMVMLPTLDNRDKWKTQKLNPLLTDTPIVRDLLGGNRSRDAANRQDMIDFPGGVLFLAGGNSPNSYAQTSVRIIILDDFDRFPAEVGNEGDVETLADGRTKAFRRAIRCKISTPVLKGGLIDKSYEASDQRRYHVPCPHCDTPQPIRWPFIKWNESLTHAWMVCEECGAEIQEHHKPEMLRRGRWVSGNPKAKIRGYHISALYAPIGLGPTWLELAEKWMRAQGDVAKMQAFINTDLGEPWEEKGDAIEPTGLLARLEEFPDTLQVLYRTAGVDVQKDRLEITFDDWTAGEECWRHAHVILAGDTAQQDVWNQLAELFNDMKPDAVAIDSGYNTSMVYAFVEKRKYCYAVKGMQGGHRPLVEDERVRKQRLRRQRRKGIQVHIVGVDQAKALLFARLKLTEPGPGYIHFANQPDFDDEYFAQLTAEKLVTRMRGTRPVAEWVQSRPRNEALDCSNYSLAALRLSGVDLSQRVPRTIEHNNDPAYSSAPAKVVRKTKRFGGIADSDWGSRL
jgi:phage terminase large subunit GpA-like protein